MLRIVLAALHLLALGIGFGSVWARANALGERPFSAAAARRAIRADAWWGIAALLWIGTGLWRALASTEKATAYYMHNHVFFAKMGLFLVILALEITPIVVMGRWRKLDRQLRDQWQPDVQQAARMRTISHIEAFVVFMMVIAAVMLARGYGANL